jgi:hypothetical protein
VIPTYGREKNNSKQTLVPARFTGAGSLVGQFCNAVCGDRGEFRIRGGGDIAAVQDDNSVMQFLAQTRAAAEAYLKALRQYANDIRELPVGSPTPDIPADASYTCRMSSRPASTNDLSNWTNGSSCTWIHERDGGFSG